MNLIKITLFVFFAIFQINSLTCGGNCPAGNCQTCDCGTTANYPNLDNVFSGRAWE
jgi:hypothetical protein